MQCTETVKANCSTVTSALLSQITIFRSHSELIDHTDNMHRNYSYEQCEFVSYGQFIMQDHMRTSHLHLAFNESEFVAKNKGGLMRHRKSKHV